MFSSHIALRVFLCDGQFQTVKGLSGAFSRCGFDPVNVRSKDGRVMTVKFFTIRRSRLVFLTTAVFSIIFFFRIAGRD